MADYYLDPATVDIAEGLNPLLDEIASLPAEQALLIDQGMALAVTLIDDAMQETMDALASLYSKFAGEAMADMTVSSIFQPFVDRAEQRVNAVAAAVKVAIAEEEDEEESAAANEEAFAAWFNDLFGANGPLGGAA